MGLAGSKIGDGRGGSIRQEDVKNIVDSLLQQMMGRMDIADLYSLADPERCKQYLVVSADALKTVLSSIELNPSKGSKDKIYFQRLSALRKKNPYSGEQEKFCKQLAFFYVRIFQIFAAVALTILDVSVMEPTSWQANGKVVSYSTFQQAPAPGIGQQQRSPLRRFFGFGGAKGNMRPIITSNTFRRSFITDAGLEEDNSILYYILKNLVISNDATVESRSPLYFDKYSDLGDIPEDGELYIEQNSIYHFTKDMKEILKDKELTGQANTGKNSQSNTVTITGPITSTISTTQANTANKSKSQAVISSVSAPLIVTTSLDSTPIVTPPGTPSKRLARDSVTTRVVSNPPFISRTASSNINKVLDFNIQAGGGYALSVVLKAEEYVKQGRDKFIRYRKHDNDDDFNLDIIYKFKEFGRTNTIKSIMKLQLKQKSNSSITRDIINVTLINFNIVDDPSCYGKIKDTKINIEFILDDKGELSERSSKLKLPAAIIKNMLGVYRTCKPETFSVIQYLMKSEIIPSIYKTELTKQDMIKIPNTNISIKTPKDLISRTEIPIRFKKTNMEIVIKNSRETEKQKEVRITANLKIDQSKGGSNDVFTYAVTLNFKDSEDIEPAYLRSYLPTGPVTKYFTSDTKYGKALSKQGDTIPTYLESYFNKIVKKETGDDANGFDDREKLPKSKNGKTFIPYNSSALDDKYKILKYYQAIRAPITPKAHCIARAIQLLDVNAIEGRASEGVSNICNDGFPFMKGDMKSLPEPEKKITSEIGLAALSQLFFEILGPIKQDEELARRVRLLKQQFERLDVEPEVAVGSLSEITNKRPAFCKSGSTEPIRIQKVSGVRSVAKKLKGRQEQHLANALNIFYRLFQKGNLQGSVLKLNERIWSGGMKEVDRIAEKARDVLIEYYMDCESIYNEGVQMVGQMVSPEAPVAVAATPTNQAPNKKLNVSAATVEGSKK